MSSSSDTEDGSMFDKTTTTTAEKEFIPQKIKELKKWEEKQVFIYIGELHDFLRKNQKKLKKCKEQIKQLLQQVEQLQQAPPPSPIVVKTETEAQEQLEAQTSESLTTNDAVKKEEEEEYEETSAAAEAFNFVAEIRQAAEQAQHINGFVYEPTSGLYYDQKTGYYYNAEYGLYYDGNTGCYYSYNQEKKTFEFHSQVQVQPNLKTTKANDDDDEDIFGHYDGEDDVEFDEFGVITDQKKLQDIKASKEKLKRHKNKEKKAKKSAPSTTIKRERRKHKSKKRQRSRRRSKSDSDSNSSRASDSESERNKRRRRKRRLQEIEDGELSSSSDSSSRRNSRDTRSRSRSRRNSRRSSRSDSEHELSKSGSWVTVFTSGSRFQDIAKKYPPSLRIIVQETNLDELKVGSLSLITFKGGSLGREGNHDVIIPDVNVSKFHLKFNYDSIKSIYKVSDLGSRNGTILNGTRMSTSKSESDEHDLVHGSIIQIAQTKLLCHVHEGNSTCGLCEPGLLIEPETAAPVAAPSMVVLTHKEQLKKLQRKYGLENEKFVDGGGAQTAPGNYNDRAATRRIKVGSSTDKEKTQTASVNTAISAENKGFKMLSKLGWSKGEALGKTNSSAGLLEPINVSSNEGKKGLGCDEPTPTTSIALSAADKRKIDTWKKTQVRYQKADIFCDSEESS